MNREPPFFIAVFFAIASILCAIVACYGCGAYSDEPMKVWMRPQECLGRPNGGWAFPTSDSPTGWAAGSAHWNKWTNECTIKFCPEYEGEQLYRLLCHEWSHCDCWRKGQRFENGDECQLREEAWCVEHNPMGWEIEE